MTNQSTFPPHDLPPDLAPDLDRSASLRRLDWRFLLPDPPGGSYQSLLLGGGSKGLARRMVETKWARSVSFSLNELENENGKVDAAILLQDSPFHLSEAAPKLNPGGTLYCELTRQSFIRLGLTPQRLRSHLAEFGLRLTGLYWAAPNFDHCRRYIPLDRPGALQWYFSSLFVAGTPLHLALRAFFRRAMSIHAHRLAWIAPCLSLTAVAGTVDAPPPSLLGQKEIIDILPQSEMRPLLLTSGQDDGSRLILLPFGPHSRRPEAVVKIATDAKFNGETEAEQKITSLVRSLLSADLRVGVPRGLAAFQYRGVSVSVEECAPGHSLWVSSGELSASHAAKIQDMQLGAKWLIQFHLQTEAQRIRWDEQAITRWIEQPLAEYARLRSISASEAQLFDLMRFHANALIGAQIPLVWQHHDFAPWNLFRQGSSLSVIDWEFNRDWDETRAGPPLSDLLYFLTYWNNIVHRHHSDEAEMEGLRQLYLQDEAGDRYIQAARRAITEYLAALHLDGRFVPLFLAYTWIERVLYSEARTQKLEGQTGSSRAGGKFAAYVATIARHADHLFSGEQTSYRPAEMREDVVAKQSVSSLSVLS